MNGRSYRDVMMGKNNEEASTDKVSFIELQSDEEIVVMLLDSEC